MEIYGIVTVVYAGTEDGWYGVETGVKGGESLKGVSITGEVLTIGERVNVVQCDFQALDGNTGYGFFKENYEYSTIGIPYAQREAIKNIAPHSYLLAHIAHKAYNKEVMYGTGEITSFLSSLGVRIVAKVSLFLSATSTYLSFASNLDRDAFEIGDKVLVSYWPSPANIILGWWETVPGEKPIPPTAVYPVWRMFEEDGKSYIAKSYISRGAEVNVFTKEISLDLSARSGFVTGRASSHDIYLYGACKFGNDVTGYSYNTETETFLYYDFTPSAVTSANIISFAGGKILYLKCGTLYISDYDGANEQDISPVVPPNQTFVFVYANMFYLNGDYFVLAQYGGGSYLFNLTNGLSFTTSAMSGVKLAGYNEATGEYYVLCNTEKNIFDPSTMTILSSEPMELAYNVGVAPAAMSQNNTIKFGNSWLYKQGSTSVYREDITNYYVGQATWLLSERDY